VKECSETLFGLSFRFLVCLLVKSKKKKKIRSFFFCKNGKNIFRTTNTSRARREKYALYLLHLPLCCDSLSSRVVEVFERAVVR
jgi:hypothetical protein